MKVALIGPNYAGGSIPPYLDVFASALRREGCKVHRFGSAGLPYDAATQSFWSVDRIVDEARTLLRDVDLASYDLASIHFGNLEIEQLLPMVWPNKRPPTVYHVHSLAWTLFTAHQPAPDLRAAVDTGIAQMDGFVFFGNHAKQAIESRYGSSAPSTVAWLPTTIPPGTRPVTPNAVESLLGQPNSKTLIGSLYGYPAPWKDISLLRKALDQATAPARVLVASTYWAERPQTNDQARLAVVLGYLHAPARQALVTASHVGIFPYRTHPTFQGSGAIADYLANAVPIVATDVANMAELIGDAGIIAPPGDATLLAEAIDRLGYDHLALARCKIAARQRAHRFTAKHHADTCLRFYEQLVERTGRHTSRRNRRPS